MKREIVSIIGVGLIGGSLGMALRKKKAFRVFGVGRNASRLKKAVSMGAVDRAFTDLGKGVNGAGIVVISTPVGVMPGIVKRIIPFLKKGCVITDTGSTKKEIVGRIGPMLPKNIFFVGAHPVAGSEQAGVRNAAAGLFRKTSCILTPVPGTNQKALDTVAGMWRKAGANIVFAAPARHDSILACTSHLPHLAAAALVGTAFRNGGDIKKFTAGGFRDTTRVASSSPEMWRDIFISNRAGVLKAVKMFRSELSGIEGLIKKNKSGLLRKKLASAKKFRDSLFNN